MIFSNGELGTIRKEDNNAQDFHGQHGLKLGNSLSSSKMQKLTEKIETQNKCHFVQDHESMQSKNKIKNCNYDHENTTHYFSVIIHNLS